jgi:glycosyltransferase involved in cell wall biosynthesis
MEETYIDRPGIDAPRKSESYQISYFERGMERMSQSMEAKGEIRRFYTIGNTTVCLIFAGDALVHLLTPALAHLEIKTGSPADLEIYIWDSDSTGIEMLPPPCNRSCFTERGDFWGFNSKRIRMAFHYSDFTLNMMDMETNRGFFWVKSAQQLPVWVFAAPFRSLFQWWMEKNGGQLLHAAAVGTPDGAVLITGKGGVGKSTTALSCLKNGLFYLADDYLLVTTDPSPVVYSLYGTAKLLPDDLIRFPELHSGLAMNDDESEKQLIFIYPEYRDRVVRSLPLRAIMKPEVKPGEPCHLSEISYHKILGALSFTTMTQLPYAGEYTTRFIADLIRKLPCYLLTLNRNLDAAPELIRHYLEGNVNAGSSLPVAEHLSSRPLISVIIPVYNGEKFISDAMNAVENQHYPSLEIIFVDDGSTDRSSEIIAGLKTDHRYFYQENQGPAIARNKGIREATGDFIAFLDVDDQWPDNNLHNLMDELLSNDRLLLVHGYAQHTEKNADSGQYEYLGNPGESFPGFLGAGLYRKEVFSILGMFDPRLAYSGEDADWFKRVAEKDIAMKKLEEVTLFVRRHGENMTGGKNLLELNALQVFKRSLDRVRNPYGEKMTTVDVSVIIPVYNAGNYLTEAIHSVLSQEVAYKEIIVVDDGSSDESLAIAERFQPLVRILKQKHKGAAAARNTGIEEASGTYLAFLDADDLWLPGHTALLLKALEENPGFGIAAGDVEQFISPECYDTCSHRLRAELKQMKGMHQGSMLFRRDCFGQVGLLNQNLKLAEFVDWLARAEHQGVKILHTGNLVYKRRLHDANQGILNREFMTDYTQVLRNKIKREG